MSSVDEKTKMGWWLYESLGRRVGIFELRQIKINK